MVLNFLIAIVIALFICFLISKIIINLFISYEENKNIDKNKIKMFNLCNKYFSINFEDFLALSNEERISLKLRTLIAICETRIHNKKLKD